LKIFERTKDFSKESKYTLGKMLCVMVNAIQEESAQKDNEIAVLKAFNQDQQKVNQDQQKQIEELKLLIFSRKK
jgi:hypothetical protein